MKFRFLSAAFLLLLLLLLTGCNDTPASDADDTSTVETTAPYTEPYDPFDAVRNSGENWLAVGLNAYENGKKPQDLKEFFANTANMTYLTLYDHTLAYDAKTTVPVAEALFAFIYDTYGAEALLDREKRCEYKSAYLRSLGLDTDYLQAEEVEAFFTSVDFSSDETYKYILTFDNVTYYYKDFNVGALSQYNAVMYFGTTGLWKMIHYLQEQNLTDRFDTDRAFHYYMTLETGKPSVTTYKDRNMYINAANNLLHEAVHAMGISTDDNIWLSEGICNYFGQLMGFHEQIASSYIQILMMAEAGYYDKRVSAGDLSAIKIKKLYETYTNYGGTLSSITDFNFRLYADAAAKIQFEYGDDNTLGSVHASVNNKECTSVGAELTYDQTSSLILYLIDAYGIEAILDAYETQDVKSALGKSYDELKADWLSYLDGVFAE